MQSFLFPFGKIIRFIENYSNAQYLDAVPQDVTTTAYGKSMDS